MKLFVAYFLFGLLLLGFASADTNQTSPEGQPYTIGLTQVVANVTATLRVIAPFLSIILMTLGGIVYGLSFTQHAEVRGKWQTTGIGLFVGGVIIMAITVAAPKLQEGSGTLLTS